MGQSRWFGHWRRFVGFAAMLALIVALLPPTATARAADWAPPDVVYFPTTQHQLAEPFLSFWRDNGRTALIGEPISEAITANGITLQYFEKARLELHGDEIIRGAVGTEYLQARKITASERPNRPRLLRGDEFDEPASNPFTRLLTVALPNEQDHRFFAETGHTLNSSFKLAWEQGGVARYGYPLSEEFAEVSPIDGKLYTTQYFERARFEYHPEVSANYSVVLTPIGSAVATQQKVNLAPVAQGDLPAYEEALFTPPAPTAKRPSGAPGGAKLIDVNLSAQYLTAFEGSTVVFEGYVSSGRGENVTPVGTFTIFSKLVSDDMRGADPNLPGGAYFQPDVPYVMYFAGGGYAIHGVYWHNNFGTPMSHGCVGLPVGSSSFLYNWAPIGTVVYIHY